MKILTLFIVLIFSSCALANIQYEVKTVKSANVFPKYTIEIHYPQIKNAKFPAEKEYNSLIQKYVVKSEKIFKNQVHEFDKPSIPAELRKNGSSLKITFQQWALSPSNIISIRFLKDVYLVGAAHPSMTYHSINYDLNHRKVLSLRQFFTFTTPYLVRLRDESWKVLKPKLKNNMFKEGLYPQAKNYEVWNINNKNLKLTFNEYQVAAYVYGPQEVIIPFKNLKGILAKSSPIYHCLKTQQCTISYLGK